MLSPTTNVCRENIGVFRVVLQQLALRLAKATRISFNCGLKGIVQEILDEEHSGHNGY